MGCEYVERTLGKLLYQRPYLGSIKKSKVYALFPEYKRDELEKCLKRLPKVGRGWEERDGYLVNTLIIDEILNEKRPMYERELEEYKRRLHQLKEEQQIIEEARNIWTNSKSNDEHSTILRIYACLKLTQCLEDISERMRDIREECRETEALLRDIEFKLKHSYRAHAATSYNP